jgi:S1-C subfamily serine protease
MPSFSRALLVFLFVASVQSLSAQQRRLSVRNGTVEVIAAIVGDELQVRPVPLLTIEIWRQEDTSKASLRTGLDGHARLSLPPGDYHLRTAQTPRIGGKRYSWLVDFRIDPAKVTRLEVTNANAAIDSTVVPTPVSGRALAPEIALYDRLKSGVLQVRADLGTGTGFVLDTLDGVVITNAHVVANAENVSVVLQSGARVPAVVLAKNADADVAVLRMPRAACDACTRLRVARADSSGVVVLPGERVVAIGFPLYQRSTVTAGIVSVLRERAIISDVNINEGNSGGPLVNMQGDVVAINTFGVSSSKGGPGLGGSILLLPLLSVLDQAREADSRRPPPDLMTLPMLDTAIYPLTTMRSVADTASFEAYKKYGELRFGDFMIGTSTTLSKLVAYREYEETIARDRRKRETRAGLSEEQRYSEFGEFHDWMEYVGNLLAPAVTIEVTPRAGETSGSAWGRALSAFAGTYGGRAKFEFKGDVQAVHWYRNGEPLMPVMGGRAPQVALENNAWVTMNDVAYRGMYVFSPEDFAPDSGGAPPSIVLQIDDLKHYDRFILRELPPDLVARVWNDFQPYFASIHPEKPFVLSDPERFSSDFSDRCSASQLCSGFVNLNRTLH